MDTSNVQKRVLYCGSVRVDGYDMSPLYEVNVCNCLGTDNFSFGTVNISLQLNASENTVNCLDSLRLSSAVWKQEDESLCGED